MLKDFKIKSKKDVREFFSYLINELKIDIHPDDDFKEYVNIKTGVAMFTSDEALKLNCLMDKCFVVAGDDVYKICGEVKNI